MAVTIKNVRAALASYERSENDIAVLTTSLAGLKWSWGGSRVRLDEKSRPTDQAWELVESRFLFERDKYVRVLAAIRAKGRRPNTEKTVA